MAENKTDYFVEWTCLACQKTWLMPIHEVKPEIYERQRASYCPYCGTKFQDTCKSEGQA